jgi:quercetin dioxygenase-like cupin family protein/predicted DNA-binding protein (MmcQ/YjbR family)
MIAQEENLMSIKSNEKTVPVVHRPESILKDVKSLKFQELSRFNQGSVGVFVASKGVSPWEYHADSDEFLYVLEGEVEVTVLAEDETHAARLTAGSCLVIPRGHWHRHCVSKHLKELFVRPGSTEYSEVDDPRRSKSPGSKGTRQSTEKTLPEQIRQYALSFPETHEDQPWGYPAFKVKNKMFVCMSFRENGINLTVKLTKTQLEALALPFVQMSGYGLGEHGWITAELKSGENRLPVQVIQRWIEESFRAVAPKTVLKQFDADANGSDKPKSRRAHGATNKVKVGAAKR